MIPKIKIFTISFSLRSHWQFLKCSQFVHASFIVSCSSYYIAVIQTVLSIAAHSRERIFDNFTKISLWKQRAELWTIDSHVVTNKLLVFWEERGDGWERREFKCFSVSTKLPIKWVREIPTTNYQLSTSPSSTKKGNILKCLMINQFFTYTNSISELFQFGKLCQVTSRPRCG